MTNVVAGLVAFIGIIGFIAVAAIWRGYVVSVLWGWFAVPLLHLPPMGVAQAMAIGLLASVLTHQYVPSDSDKEDWWKQFFYIALMPLAALLIAWILKGFI